MDFFCRNFPCFNFFFENFLPNITTKFTRHKYHFKSELQKSNFVHGIYNTTKPCYEVINLHFLTEEVQCKYTLFNECSMMIGVMWLKHDCGFQLNKGDYCTLRNSKSVHYFQPH